MGLEAIIFTGTLAQLNSISKDRYRIEDRYFHHGAYPTNFELDRIKSHLEDTLKPGQVGVVDFEIKVIGSLYGGFDVWTSGNIIRVAQRVTLGSTTPLTNTIIRMPNSEGSRQKPTTSREKQEQSELYYYMTQYCRTAFECDSFLNRWEAYRQSNPNGSVQDYLKTVTTNVNGTSKLSLDFFLSTIKKPKK